MSLTSIATRALAGRRENALLDLPSVRRMAEVLAVRCREPSWIRTTVASLDRFRALSRYADLEGLLAEARDEPELAERALQRLAQALDGHTEVQVAALAMGPKVWLRLNGIAVPWRPLPGAPTFRPLATPQRHTVDRLVLLALIGSGLYLAELLRLNVGDVGSLDAHGCLVPDPQAEPLAVQYAPRRGRAGTRITFLTPQARAALVADLARRVRAGDGIDADAPLIARPDGSRATVASVARARRRNTALIRAGSQVNVALCRATGDFFREWGLPGSRFVASQTSTRS